MTRTSSLIVLLPPIRVTSSSWSTLSNLLCIFKSISPISSKKRVPVLASSNLPIRRVCASVNAPFSWPKSSLSISSLGMLLNLRLQKFYFTWRIIMNGFGYCSFPVPVSPVIETVIFVLTALSINSKTL